MPAQLLYELVRPWRIVASQLLTMVEPLCTPEQRHALRRRADLLGIGTVPAANGDASPATTDTLVSGVGQQPGATPL